MSKVGSGSFEGLDVGSRPGQAGTFSLTASTTCCAAPSVASFSRFSASSAALDAWSAAFWPPS